VRGDVQRGEQELGLHEFVNVVEARDIRRAWSIMRLNNPLGLAKAGTNNFEIIFNDFNQGAMIER
jgi:hypothetical protein